MKTIILFRFHKRAAVCLNRLQLLKQLNPTVPIYALYGGTKQDEPAMRGRTGPFFERWYRIPNQSSKWKWLHSDLATRLWFKSVGHKVDFDRLNLIEWDLLTLAPLKQLYGRQSNRSVSLTGLKPLSQVEHKWYWTTHEPWKSQWHALLAHAQKKYGYAGKPYSCVGPGASLPRTFLEKYAAINVPELVHDELRLPLFSQIFGLKLEDTKYFKRDTTSAERFYFNCHNHEISLTTIKRELAKKSGRRVFHPYRVAFDSKLLSRA